MAAVADESALRLLAEHAPLARAPALAGHRGTTFSVTPSHLLYNVADTCALLQLSNGAPTGDGPLRKFVRAPNARSTPPNAHARAPSSAAPLRTFVRASERARTHHK